MVLLSLPDVVPVEKNIFPPFVATAIVLEPKTVQFVIVLDVASAIKRIVDVTVVAETVVFEKVKLFPPVLSPSIVILSAPFKLINGEPAAIAPETVLAPPPAGAAPKLPPGSTPNADGTFNFPGNAKVPKGTYKMNSDGTITRVK